MYEVTNGMSISRISIYEKGDTKNDPYERNSLSLAGWRVAHNKRSFILLDKSGISKSDVCSKNAKVAEKFPKFSTVFKSQFKISFNESTNA